MKIKLHFMLIAFCVMTANTAIACRCQQPEASDSYNDASLVVRARVADIVTAPSGEGSTAILEITDAWKAESPSRIAVISLTNCHFPWEKKKEYIVFLSEEPNGLYSTDRCKGNQQTDNHPNIIEWLEGNATPQKIDTNTR
jgi:hypothetical protein